MFAAAKTAGYTHIAITDHGSVAGHVEAFTRGAEQGVTVILGVELYVAYGDDDTGHMTLLAQDKAGLETIYGLMADIAKTKNRIHIDDLPKYTKGTILLSGCPASPLNRMEFDDADYYAGKLRKAWGEHFYFEMQYTMGRAFANRIIALQDGIPVPIVLTNDVHIPTKQNAQSHDILSKLKSGYSFDTSELYFKSKRELILTGYSLEIDLTDTEAWIEEAESFSSKYKWDYELFSEAEIPQDEKLIKAMLSELEIVLENKIIFGDIPKKDRKVYEDRKSFELDVIRRMGYEAYFAIVWDLINYARQEKVPISPGRGSACGSLLLWLLGVTEINPIEYDLLFARFLNEFRGDFPDIDLDFAKEGREKVIQYAVERWGAYPVSTMLTWGHASLVRDLGRYLQLPKREVELAAIEGGTLEFFQFYNEIPRFRNAYDYGIKMIKTRGRHASGFVIANRIVPLEAVKDGTLCVPWSDGVSSRELTKVGLIKFDFLGLNILSALDDMKEMTDALPAKFGSDEDTLELFRSGNIFGVFQFSSPEAIKLTREYGPTKGMDIAILSALDRPGPLKSGMAEQAVQHRKNGTKRLLGLKEADDVLAETYGIIVFQEQLMKIFEIIAGATLYEADSLRKIVAKKFMDDPLWDEFRSKFIEGARDKLGMSHRKANELWTEIVAFAEYGFPKAHAVAYSVLAWNCAWYKTHFPAEYFVAMMNWDNEHVVQYMAEAVEQKVPVLSPGVNLPISKYTLSDNGIHIPLAQIKFLGESGAEYIEAERESGGEFTSCQDFIERIPKRKANKRVIKHMYASGAFNGFTDFDALPIEPEVKESIDAMSDRERERDFMGAVRLTDDILGTLDAIRAKIGLRSDYQHGLVTEIIRKTGAKRVYWKIRLYPNTEVPVYINEKPEFMVGDIILCRLKPYTRSAVKVTVR